MSPGSPAETQSTEAVDIPGTPPGVALAVHDLGVHVHRGADEVPVAEGVDLTVALGEAIAIVGESGSGKSLTVRAMLDLLPPGVAATGSVEYDGRQLGDLTPAERRALHGAGLALVMQDPFTMLNPLQRVGDQVTAALGRGRRGEAVERLREVGITDPRVADRYPFEVSGGMRQRVAIAAAIAENPRVLIADEPTTALDVATQRDILALLDRLRTTHGLALVLVTHDLRVATTVCDRVYVMYAGRVVESSPSASFIADPRHPYSRSLLAADPPLDRRLSLLPTIPGGVPAPGHRPPGCRFAPRCSLAEDACTTAEPELREHEGKDHWVRCRRAEAVPHGDVRHDLAAVAPAHQRAGPTLVRLRGVRKVFSGSAVALDGVDLEIGEGESVGLIGESGSGKSTLARILVGLSSVTDGEVAVGGTDLTGRLTRRERAAVRGTVQIAFQDPSSTLNPRRTVGSTLAEALRLVHRRYVARRTEELLELVGLPPAYALRRPGGLSGGERQRVALARALAREPRLLVCDEIVSALDVSVQAHILNLLGRLRSELGLALLFITHDLAVVRQVADRAYVLQRGLVVEQGPTEQLLDYPSHAYTRSLVDALPGGTGALGSEPLDHPEPQ